MTYTNGKCLQIHGIVCRRHRQRATINSYNIMIKLMDFHMCWRVCLCSYVRVCSNRAEHVHFPKSAVLHAPPLTTLSSFTRASVRILCWFFFHCEFVATLSACFVCICLDVLFLCYFLDLLIACLWCDRTLFACRDYCRVLSNCRHGPDITIACSALCKLVQTKRKSYWERYPNSNGNLFASVVDGFQFGHISIWIVFWTNHVRI